MPVAMVFCVSCGHKLAGRYCGQCGGDSQSTADAQAEVPVLTVPAGGAKKLLTRKDRSSKTSQRQKVAAARDASKHKGSAAGGIGVASAKEQRRKRRKRRRRRMERRRMDDASPAREREFVDKDVSHFRISSCPATDLQGLLVPVMCFMC